MNGDLYKGVTLGIYASVGWLIVKGEPNLALQMLSEQLDVVDEEGVLEDQKTFDIADVGVQRIIGALQQASRTEQ